MNKKIKYNDVMENLTMTPEMEKRILKNLKKAEAEDNTENVESKSNTVRFRRRWITSLSAAAAAFVVIIGSVTANNLVSRIAPEPSSETATNDSSANDSSTNGSSASDSSANDSSNGDTTLSSTGGFSSSSNNSGNQSEGNASTSSISGTNSDSRSNGSDTDDSSNGNDSYNLNGANHPTSENNDVTNGHSSKAASSNANESSTKDSARTDSRTSNNSNRSSKTNSSSIVSGSKTSNGSNKSVSNNNDSKTNNGSSNNGSKDDNNSDTVVSGNNGSETDTDMGSLSELEKAAGFEITEPALPFDVGDTNYLMLHDGIAEIDYTSKDQTSSLYFDQSDDENAIDSRFSDQFSGYDTVEEFSVNTAKITAYGTSDGYMMVKVTNGSSYYVLSVTAPISLDEWKSILTSLCD